jgi:Putative T7SS secretion signal domain
VKRRESSDEVSVTPPRSGPGPAADAFRAKFHGQPAKWLEACDCFRAAADAIDTHAKTLTWAQREAAAAIEEWNAAEAATSSARQQYAACQWQ